MRLLLLCRLNCSQCDGVDDIVNQCVMGQVVNWFVYILQYWFDGDQVGRMLYCFVGGVIGVQIWEDEYGSVICNWRVWCFGFCNVSYYCSVVLQWIVDYQVRMFFLCQMSCFVNFFYVVICIRSIGGVGEYSNVWFDIEGCSGISGLNCDFCQLFSGWIWVDCIVIVNVNLFWQQYEEYGRYQGVVWCSFDQLQWWMDGVCGSVNSIGNQIINFILFQYQCIEYYVVFQLFVGNGFGYVFVFMQFDQMINIVFVNYFWINDFNFCIQFYILRCCNMVDFCWIIQQYVSCDIMFSIDSGCFNGMWFVIFWQYDMFVCFVCKFSQLIMECRWRQMMVVFRSGSQRFDLVSVDVVSNVFLNFFDMFVIVNWNFQVEVLQVQRGLLGVGVYYKYWQVGSESMFVQFRNVCVYFVVVSQQQGIDFYVVYGCQVSGYQYVRMVCGSYQQRIGMEVFQYVWNVVCVESDGFNVVSIDVVFVDDGCIQVVSYIDCMSCDQVKVLWYSVENWQWVGFLQFCWINIVYFSFGRVVENFGQIWVSMILFINWCVQFVNDNVGDVGVFGIVEVVVGQFDMFFQLFWGVSVLRYNEDDFCIQCFSDFVVQRLGKLVFMCWDQIFNQNDFSVFGVSVVVCDDFFYQYIFLIVGKQIFNVVYFQWFSGCCGGRVCMYDSCSLIGCIVIGMWLSDRFENVQMNVFVFYCMDYVKVDVGQIDVGFGRDQYNNMGYGLFFFVIVDLVGYKIVLLVELVV